MSHSPWPSRQTVSHTYEPPLFRASAAATATASHPPRSHPPRFTQTNLPTAAPSSGRTDRPQVRSAPNSPTYQNWDNAPRAASASPPTLSYGARDSHCGGTGSSANAYAPPRRYDPLLDRYLASASAPIPTAARHVAPHALPVSSAAAPPPPRFTAPLAPQETPPRPRLVAYREDPFASRTNTGFGGQETTCATSPTASSSAFQLDQVLSSMRDEVNRYAAKRSPTATSTAVHFHPTPTPISTTHAVSSTYTADCLSRTTKGKCDMSDLSAISHCSSESSIGSASQSVSSVGAPQFPTSTATVTSTLASPRTPLTSVEQSVRSELLSMRQSIAEWHQLMRDSADRTDAHDATLDQHRAQLETIAGTLSDLIEFKRQDEEEKQRQKDEGPGTSSGNDDELVRRLHVSLTPRVLADVHRDLSLSKLSGILPDGHVILTNGQLQSQLERFERTSIDGVLKPFVVSHVRTAIAAQHDTLRQSIEMHYHSQFQAEMAKLRIEILQRLTKRESEITRIATQTAQRTIETFLKSQQMNSQSPQSQNQNAPPHKQSWFSPHLTARKMPSVSPPSRVAERTRLLDEMRGTPSPNNTNHSTPLEDYTDWHF